MYLRKFKYQTLLWDPQQLQILVAFIPTAGHRDLFPQYTPVGTVDYPFYVCVPKSLDTMSEGWKQKLVSHCILFPYIFTSSMKYF